MSSPETMKQRAWKYMDSLRRRKMTHDGTMMYSDEVVAFAEKESLDRAIEELESVLNEYCKPESQSCLILLGERIAELKAAQKEEVKK